VAQTLFSRRSQQHLAVAAAQAVGGDDDQICVLVPRQCDDLGVATVGKTKS